MGTIIEREACTDFPLCRLRGGGASSSASTRPEPTPKWFGPEVDATGAGGSSARPLGAIGLWL